MVSTEHSIQPLRGERDSILHRDGTEIGRGEQTVCSPRPISAPQLTELSDKGTESILEPRRCASQLDLVSKKDGLQLPNVGRSGPTGIRDINMSKVKDIDQLASLGLLRLRFALQCRGLFWKKTLIQLFSALSTCCSGF